jgi:ketosteroid isomerase-like protein
VSEGSEFAERVYAAINARDRAAIKAMTAPDIELLEDDELGDHVVVSMRQRGRGKASGAEVTDHITHVWTLRDGLGTRLQSFANHEDAVGYAQHAGEKERE